MRFFNLGYLSLSVERSDILHHENLKNNYFTSYDFSNEREWNNIDIYYDNFGNRFSGTSKNQDIEYQTIDIEDYWYCTQGNKHPISQKICRCYWEKISKEI